MFTGLIQCIGTIRAVTARGSGLSFQIDATGLPTEKEPLQLGESIAVNGVCLTIAKIVNPTTFEADVLEETVRCTMFKIVRPGMNVNLERALRFGDRLGGHLVTGHVDGVGYLLAHRDEGQDKVFRFSCGAEFARKTVRKGSVAVAGTSLTVCAVGSDWFEVALIPTTLHETVLGELTLGATVNLESDLLGAYVRRALGCDSTTSLRQIIAAGFAD